MSRYYPSIKVLITGAGAPGIKGTLFSLKNNWDNRTVTTVCVDMRNDVVGKYLCDKFYQVPPGNHEQFVPRLLDICEKEKVDVILPQVTEELMTLSLHKKVFEEIGVHVAVSEFDVIQIANDKYKLMNFIRKMGLPIPKFYIVRTWSELEKISEKLGSPFVIKPPISSGMRGLRIVCKSRKMKAILKKPFLGKNLRG